MLGLLLKIGKWFELNLAYTICMKKCSHKHTSFNYLYTSFVLNSVGI